MKFVQGRIVRFRKQAKLSREQLARKMLDFIPTCSSEAIRQWEVGRCKPSPVYMAALCKALKRKEKEFYDI